MKLLIGVLFGLTCACVTDTKPIQRDRAGEPDPCVGEVRVENGYKHQRITLRDEDDLRALTNFKVITGELLVENSKLTNLDGLEKLKSILGGLRITGNRNLTNVAGLSSLSLVDFLEIENNPSLATLAGLERVKTRETIRNSRGHLEDAGWVVLNDNRALENLEGLLSLDRVFSLEIRGNSALQNLHGLEGISSIFDGLFITDNASLTDMACRTLVADEGSEVPGCATNSPLCLAHQRCRGCLPTAGGTIRCISPASVRRRAEPMS